MFDPALKLATPYLINLKEDPKERITNIPRSQWVSQYFYKILGDFQKSLEREPLIPAGAPLDATPADYLPGAKLKSLLPKYFPIAPLPGFSD
ncbi:MAG: hypothetical protein F6K18_15140 [Okeania sp. SIO2C2]|nr:hypothetical protein [Okeania sp. SIO2C2]